VDAISCISIVAWNVIAHQIVATLFHSDWIGQTLSIRSSIVSVPPFLFCLHKIFDRSNILIINSECLPCLMATLYANKLCFRNRVLFTDLAILKYLGYLQLMFLILSINNTRKLNIILVLYVSLVQIYPTITQL